MHKLSFTILYYHKMNHLVKKSCKLFVRTPGKKKTKKTEATDTTIDVVILGETVRAAILFLYGGNCIQTPTHSEQSTSTRQTARGNTQTPLLSLPKNHNI